MNTIKETPLFVLDSELSAFGQRHEDYKYYMKVFDKDGNLAGYLAYKNNPNK